MKRPGIPPLWKSEELYFTGDAWYQAILRDIENARSFITMEIYIFDDDDIGRRIFAALEAAAARGVQVRMMLDAVGSHIFIQKLLTTEYHPNIRVKVFNPLPWTFSYQQFSDLWRMAEVFMQRLLWINRRDHRKIITFDEEIAYVGSFNISDTHCREYSKDNAWEDVGMRLNGWVAPLFVLSMMRHWSVSAFLRQRKLMPKRRFVRFSHPDLRLNQTFYLRRLLYRDFLLRLRHAHTRIWLRPGYFLPKKRLVRLLMQAARRGVDVRVLLSTKSDVFYYGLMQSYYLPLLIDSGVKVYRFSRTITHAKNYFIDDSVTVGSTNLNYRSFMHDLEVDLFVQHPANRRLMDEHFEKMAEESELVTLQSLGKRPWWERYLVRLVFHFRYWN